VHPLTSVREKVGRAREHHEVLHREFDSFMKDDPDSPWGLAFDLDHKVGECRFWWRQEEPTPLRWSVILGEFLYDLRSALDHLARQLVLANGRKPDNRTEFPVFKSEDDFEGRSCPKTRGMSAKVKALLLEIQPFREWPENPMDTTLWGIQNLCNFDKHKLLHLTDPWLMTAEMNVTGPGVEWIQKPRRMRLYDKAKICAYRWDTSADTNVNMNFGFSLDVALAEGQWQPEGAGQPSEGMSVLHLMDVCLKYMETTFLPRFEPFFPDATQN